MGTIVRGTKSGTGTTSFGAGTTGLSSEVNTDFNTVYAAVNGNIDNDNIKAGAGIEASKLALGTIAQNVSNTGSLTNTGDVSFIGDVDTIGNVDITGKLTCDSLQLTGATVITSILDEDTMASDSATALPTQQSVKAYVDNNTSSGWSSLSTALVVGTTYQATGDGIIILAASSLANSTYVQINSDESNPPTTARGVAGFGGTAGTSTGYMTITIPVQSGKYFKALQQGSPSISAYEVWYF